MLEDINSQYYASPAPGRLDYWKNMAAPRFRAATLVKELRKFNFESLVDLGCGSGLLLEEISKYFPLAKYGGVDFSVQQIELNKRILPQFRWELFDLGEERAVPKEFLNAFDIAICSEVIEHLDDPRILLAHARALTKPHSGILILTTQSGRIGETEKRVGHKRHFSKAALQDLCQSSGWEILHIWNAGFPFHDISKWLANRNPDKTMKRFSEKAYGPLENMVCWLLRGAFLINSHSTGAQLFAVAKQK